MPVPLGLALLTSRDSSGGPRVSMAVMDTGGRLQDRGAVEALGWRPATGC
ncbi:hypothetical protein [Amycolatopsis sp. DSM 110486]|nr:hypothetical protein [Amycolatopsis sp. DSM 110486]